MDNGNIEGGDSVQREDASSFFDDGEDSVDSIDSGVAFPGADYFERQAEEDEDAEYEGLAPVYRDYDSWLDTLERLLGDLTPECVAAYDNGELDDELLASFKDGKSPVWAKSFILRGWEADHREPEEDSYDGDEGYDFEFPDGWPSGGNL